MELLLALLSLITAATGVVSGARAPETGVHQMAGVIAPAPARKAMPRVAVAQEVQPSRREADASPVPPAETPSAAPLYANRRRE